MKPIPDLESRCVNEHVGFRYWQIVSVTVGFMAPVIGAVVFFRSFSCRTCSQRSYSIVMVMKWSWVSCCTPNKVREFPATRQLERDTHTKSPGKNYETSRIYQQESPKNQTETRTEEKTKTRKTNGEVIISLENRMLTMNVHELIPIIPGIVLCIIGICTNKTIIRCIQITHVINICKMDVTKIIDHKKKEIHT